MAKGAKRRRATTQRRATQHVPPPTITGLLTERLNPWAALALKITTIASVVTVAATVYRYLDLPVPVTHTTLKSSIEDVKTDVTGKIGQTKTEVLDTANKNTEDVKLDVGTVKTKVDLIARKQDQAKIAALEVQARVLFLQKTQLSGTLNAVEAVLRERTGDGPALARKTEVESFIKFVDRDMETVQIELRKARQGE